MKNSSLNFKSLAFIGLIAIVSVLSSCNKDDDNAPDYVGNWTMTEVSDGITLTNDLTCTENSFTLVGFATLKVYDASGGLSVVGNEMTITPTKIGAINPETFRFTYYESGVDDEFDNLIAYSPIGAGGKGQYSVANNKLSITFDTNSNGKFDDSDDVLVFNRK